MYNQDNEGNLPPEVVRFKNELARADGVLIVTPEHDRSIPAVLKNAIDWGARPWGKNSWIGKPGFITGTSPGAIGSALAQQHLRSVMTGLGMILLGGEAYVTFKPNLIDDHGNIGDESTRKFLAGFCRSLRASGVPLDLGGAGFGGVGLLRVGPSPWGASVASLEGRRPKRCSILRGPRIAAKCTQAAPAMARAPEDAHPLRSARDRDHAGA